MSCFALTLCPAWPSPTQESCNILHVLSHEYIALVQVVEGYEVVKAAEACGELSNTYLPSSPLPSTLWTAILITCCSCYRDTRSCKHADHTDV